VSALVVVVRLMLADVRRHKAHTAMLLVAVTAASATLALGLSIRDVSDGLYRQTRVATAGPDVVAFAPDSGPATTSALAALAADPDVVQHNGPYQIVYSTVTARGSSSGVVVHGASPTPGAINRPLVTSGEWIRPGGVVLERGLATALDVGTGDRVVISGHSYPVVGIAVTAATSVYPWAAGIGPGGGPSDWHGLAWLTAADARVLAGRDLAVTTALDLQLRDPAATKAFIDKHHHGYSARVTFHSWQFIAKQDAVMLRSAQPILVIGGWLLGFVAISGVATLAAGRAIEQTRRAGLLKAVGATPGLIGALLLTEYLLLALLAEALGLTVARLIAPAIANPTDSRIGEVVGPTSGAIAVTTGLALAAAVMTALPPTLKALRTATVTTLSSSAHHPQHRPWLTALSALLPTPLLLGLRLSARRPGRAVLQACATATTLIAVTALLMYAAQPVKPYGRGPSALPNVRDVHDRRLLLVVAAVLIALAVVNTVAMTWMTATEARVNMAITRALGATPGQVSAGLSVAQLLSAVPGAVVGVYLGLVVFALSTAGTTTPPPWSWLISAVLTTLLATSVLTALPARWAARLPVARTLSAETL